MDLNKCTSVRCGYPLNKTKYTERMNLVSNSCVY